jgi:hypothetical protein
MNYRRIYSELISRALNENRSKQNGIYEKHHILPRSLGGNNDTTNLVLLTPREHYIAHWLLYKQHDGQDKAKMVYAFFMMSRVNPNQKRTVSSHEYNRAKHAMQKNCTGINNPNYGKNPFTPAQLAHMSLSKLGSNNPSYGKPSWNKGLTTATSSKLKAMGEKRSAKIAEEGHSQKGVARSEITKAKISKSLIGKRKSQSHKDNLSKVNMGKKLSDATKKAMSVAKKASHKIEIVICPYCEKTGQKLPMQRWHFNNCKFNL